MPSVAAPIITLTTDFGTRDPFVGIMKGVVLGICPDARLVDLTHEVAPHDIVEAGLALEASTPYFPRGTVHLAVVDPGVGSARRALALRAAEQYFVGPDNGLFSFVFAAGDWVAVSLESAAHRLSSVSQTFHGRDVFAPAAAHLAAGVSLEDLGPAVTDPVPLSRPESLRHGDEIAGEVIGTDRFGNLLTSLTAGNLRALDASGRVAVVVAGRDLGSLISSYAEGSDDAPAAIIGSSGRLEIAVRGGSARAVLGVERGAPVIVRRLPGGGGEPL